MSKDAKDLISKLLSPKPETRPKLDAIERHPWFASVEPKKKAKLEPQSFMQSIISMSTDDSSSPSSFISTGSTVI